MCFENLEMNGRFMAICDMVLSKAELTFFSIHVYIYICLRLFFTTLLDYSDVSHNKYRSF